jgi:hypothetical protein
MTNLLEQVSRAAAANELNSEGCTRYLTLLSFLVVLSARAQIGDGIGKKIHTMEKVYSSQKYLKEVQPFAEAHRIELHLSSEAKAVIQGLVGSLVALLNRTISVPSLVLD